MLEFIPSSRTTNRLQLGYSEILTTRDLLGLLYPALQAPLEDSNSGPTAPIEESYGAPAESYGAPSAAPESYGAPASQADTAYGAPADSEYDAPSAAASPVPGSYQDPEADLLPEYFKSEITLGLGATLDDVPQVLRPGCRVFCWL